MHRLRYRTGRQDPVRGDGWRRESRRLSKGKFRNSRRTHRFQEKLWPAQGRVFGESLNFEYTVGNGCADLNVAISGFGTGRGDSESEEGIVVLHKIKTLSNGVLENVLAGDEVVARRDDHGSFGVEGGYMMSSPCDTRSCVPARRLEKNIGGRNFGELLTHKRSIAFVSDNKNIFAWNEGQHAVERHLQQ